MSLAMPVMLTQRSRGARLVSLAILLLLRSNHADAAGRPVTIHTADGRSVTATVYDARTLPAPAVVLVPALGHPRDEWQGVAQALADQNITALAVDLPSPVLPGDAAELAGWSGIVQGAVTWLTSQPTVRGGAIGAAGASLGGSLTATAAAADPRIRAVALISPAADFRGLRIENALRQVGARPVLFVTSRKDGYATRSARELGKDAAGPRETYTGDAASHGVPLLTAEPDLARMVVAWFQQHLAVN